MPSPKDKLRSHAAGAKAALAYITGFGPTNHKYKKYKYMYAEDKRNPVQQHNEAIQTQTDEFPPPPPPSEMQDEFAVTDTKTNRLTPKFLHSTEPDNSGSAVEVKWKDRRHIQDPDTPTTGQNRSTL